MSRPKRRTAAAREGGMPEWLVTYRPEEWTADPADLLERYYFGRCRWLDARLEWLAGGDPVCKIKSPRPGERDGVNTSTVAEDHPPGPVPTPPDLHEWRIDGA